MARNNELGALRRSQVITTYGPGAIVDFRAGGHGGAPISVVIAGLDTWDDPHSTKTPGLGHPQTINEPRLQERLGVEGFRLPPVVAQIAPGVPKKGGDHLVGVRFPEWLMCPSCHLLRRRRQWAEEPGDPAPYCGDCSTKKKRRHAVPVRFITACRKGHLDEFPWSFWAHRTSSDRNCKQDREFTLDMAGKAGLAGVLLTCPACGACTSMEGCLGEEALKPLPCRGRRPWLPGQNETCTEDHPQALQRGASNVYFSVIVSALDIPPWSEPIQRRLQRYWAKLKDPAKRGMVIEALDLHKDLDLPSAEAALEVVNQRFRLLEDTSEASLRWEEYRQFSADDAPLEVAHPEFEIRRDEVPPEIRHWFDMTVRAVRLREVRALRGFSRIVPPTGDVADGRATIAAISAASKNWLPAVDVRGEGIFLRLRSETLREWEGRPAIVERAEKVDRAFRKEWKERTGQGDPPKRISPRFLLVHSIAHALMRQLSLECGYSTASLRERLYVGEGDYDMAALLVYTATPDSDGTLGGLARQGLPQRLATLIEGAVSSLQWCSSDPLCIKGINTTTESLNRAACHSCLLSPETSCEEFNRLLDRALLVGLPEARDLSYFAGLGGPGT